MAKYCYNYILMFFNSLVSLHNLIGLFEALESDVQQQMLRSCAGRHLHSRLKLSLDIFGMFLFSVSAFGLQSSVEMT